MSTPAGSSDPDQTRRDIQHTRAELGDTIAALATKTDVRTRLRTKTTTASDELRQRVTQAGQSAKTTAVQRSGMLSQKASQYATSVKQKAQQATTAMRGSAAGGAQTAGKAGSNLVASARGVTTRIGSSVRAKPKPVLAAAGAIATLAVVAYRRRRPR
ncbi:DUF3618 domain-containing protein [Micromonospora sp. KC213]|uniref:DUF3618 domain-containing protein n=1 Tax=Micromonospora sp. KC213 TaxID=2530378 RepID=UPI00104ED783|nr:DUF3618 domain-containing protein [Micromonospora sp. KC213]TDC38404.1 DUF3618 domain-containing protein [Micromonospora sp. KC213]